MRFASAHTIALYLPLTWTFGACWNPPQPAADSLDPTAHTISDGDADAPDAEPTSDGTAEDAGPGVPCTENCDDNDMCTLDTCDLKTGKCVHQVVTTTAKETCDG
ncbi:MAG: hypothetical protein QF464_12130, partial [Myxococcota bacterium]|nr:hypothetical protein [Myxococcota bacterium]